MTNQYAALYLLFASKYRFLKCYQQYNNHHFSMNEFGLITLRSFNFEGTALELKLEVGTVHEHGSEVQVEAPIRCAVSIRKSAAVT